MLKVSDALDAAMAASGAAYDRLKTTREAARLAVDYDPQTAELFGAAADAWDHAVAAMLEAGRPLRGCDRAAKELRETANRMSNAPSPGGVPA